MVDIKGGHIRLKPLVVDRVPLAEANGNEFGEGNAFSQMNIIDDSSLSSLTAIS